MKKILLLLLTLCSLSSAWAQDTEFWFAGPSAIIGGTNPYKGGGGFVFSNPTHRQATVNIHYYKDNSDTTLIIPAFSFNYMFYPNEQDIRNKIEDHFGPTGTVRSTAIHITSNTPITGYYIYDKQYLQETFLLKGSASLDTDFYIPTGIGGAVRSTVSNTVLGTGNAPYISIVGTENGTSVSFNLKGAVAGFPAGLSTITLNKGEVITLRSGGATLAGSHVFSDKPITITAGEECRNSNGGACDQTSDQIVANSFAGGVYVMPLSAGYMPTSPTWIQNYFQIVALEANTDVTIDWGSGPMPLTTLANAGDMFISEPISVYTTNSCATISSDKPIHIMQNTGHESTLCHLPNFYATNTHKTSFYSYWENFTGKNIYPGVSIIYNTNSKDDFTISFPGQSETPLFDWVTANARQIDGQGDVPGFAGWKYIRFTLPAAATNQIITVNNSTSVFQLGFSSSFDYGTNMNYLTAFNADFSFDPDTVWTCPGIYTSLIGGIAQNYKWTLPDGSIQQGAGLNSIKAREMGMYILEMTQGFKTVTDTCWVFSINFSKDGTLTKSLTKPFKIGRPQQFKPNISDDAMKYMTEYKWTFQGGVPATSTDADPTVVWNSTGVKEVTLYMKYETVYPDSTRAVCDSLLKVRVPVLPPNVSYYADPNSPDKAGVNDDEKSDDELYYQGRSWESPFNLEDALLQASQGDVIYVPQGTYTPKQGNAFVIDCDSVAIIGGFTGWEKDSTERVPSVEKTIIKGNGNSAVIFELGSSVGACGITTATRLEGFTIQGGEAMNGAGILFKNGASGTVANCIIRNNHAKENGGGIYTEPYTGCGTSPDPILYNLEISANTAKNGAGIYNAGSKPVLTNVTVSGNNASVSGGGIYNQNASPQIRNTIVYGNVSAGESLKNEFMNKGGIPNISYCIISGSNGSGQNWNTAMGHDGSHNIDKSPLFRKNGYTGTGAMQLGNYHLASRSPGFDTGYNGYVVDIHTDLDGYDRINFDRVDMGAYEYRLDPGTEVRHKVNIPNFPFVTTDPPAGVHFVTGHDDYTIIFIPATGYSLENMKVSSGSDLQDKKMNQTINADGSVTVVFYSITEPLNIQVSNVIPTSNDKIQGYAIWAYNNQLHVKATVNGLLKIYSSAGQLVKQLEVVAGENTIALPQGMYVVTLNDGAKQKVRIQ